ncbi:Hypothetical_protein [Hexamita inflata]|uniref:Hypothetical_protein n=1 Tax=Hexamita inflata TaxID=28002 RepID=A0AA86PDI9_9EUKA|nr:Hypothetical protein HINF_LOCUS24695 [Hexamita inflata]
MQLEQILASETHCQLDTNRVQTKHTNRVKITSQLEQQEIDRLYKLSQVVFEIMTKDNIENLDDKFQQVFEFWMEIKGSIITEWATKKSKITPIEDMFERNCEKPDIYTRNHGDFKPKQTTDQPKIDIPPYNPFISQQLPTPTPTQKLTFDWLPQLRLLIDQINDEEQGSQNEDSQID